VRETVTINADPPPDPHPKRPPPAAAQAHPAHFSRNLFKTLRKSRPPNCRELSASGTQSRGAMKNPLLRSWVACGRETRFKIESKAAETRTKSQQNGGKNHEKQQFLRHFFHPPQHLRFIALASQLPSLQRLTRSLVPCRGPSGRSLPDGVAWSLPSKNGLCNCVACKTFIISYLETNPRGHTETVKLGRRQENGPGIWLDSGPSRSGIGEAS